MNYGLYLSSSGVLTSLYRQDVFANNLANVKTVGFKPDVPTIRQRDPAVVEKGLGFDLRHDLLDRLGGGVFAGTQRINIAQGDLTATGNDLDIALGTPNAFFAIERNDAATGQRDIVLSRDGRLTLAADGTLVQMATGRPILDVNDRPIRIEPGTVVHLDDRGQVIADGEPIARLQVAAVDEPDRLIKLGDNLLGFADGRGERHLLEEPALRSRHVEASGVDPIRTLMDLVAATKAVAANGNLIRYQDSLMDRAVNVLGRVQA
jgi:flagellar basal-body rod protein FlgF